MTPSELPVPEHFDPSRVDAVWRVPYQERADEAEAWARRHSIGSASGDQLRVCLLLVDVQNTFCLPDFELFVAGPGGKGAVEDNRRLCRFIYRNLHRITRISLTMDTHQAVQIFHAVFLVDEHGNHPDPFTQISRQDVESGRWRLNPGLPGVLRLNAGDAVEYLQHYARQLEERKKFVWTIWPYHAMLGGLDHALVSSVHEAVFFHSIARSSPPEFVTKGQHPLTEHYSALGPEIQEWPDGRRLAKKDDSFVRLLAGFDRIVLAGQAKSHCVAWTIADLIAHPELNDPSALGRIYLLEDCTSPVVIPGTVDFSEEADAAFKRFSEAGLKIVRTDQQMDRWPGFFA